MKKIIRFTVMITVFTLALSAGTAVFAASPDDYYTAIEAEDCLLAGDMAIIEREDAIGGKCIVGATAEKDTFTFTFTVPKDSTYKLWMRAWHSTLEDNSLFYEIDGEKMIYDFDECNKSLKDTFPHYNRWYYRDLNYRKNSERGFPQILELSAGVHSMTFAARETGLIIDQIIITSDQNYDPNAFEGNTEVFSSCEVCYGEHLVNEPYAVIGKTPAELWEENGGVVTVSTDVDRVSETSEPLLEDSSSADSSKALPVTGGKPGGLSALVIALIAVGAVVILAAAVLFIVKKKK